MIKTARQLGVANALLSLGYSPEAIKLAFAQQGITKEAIAPAVLMRLLSPLAKGLTRGFGARLTASKASPLAGSLTKGLMERGPLAQWAGRGLHSGAQALRLGVGGLAKKPWQTVGRGLLETGKGGLFFRGKGIGGALGKGLGGYQMGNLFLGD
jgi:hypothetical protein